MNLRTWFKRAGRSADGGASQSAAAPALASAAASTVAVLPSAADVAAKLTAGERDLALAQQRFAAAYERFAAERTTEAGAALATARTDLSDVQEMLRIVAAELVASRNREAEQLREASRRRLAELDKQLTGEAIQSAGAELVAREVRARLELANAISARLELAENIRQVERERRRLLASVGLAERERTEQPSRHVLALDPTPVAAAIEARLTAETDQRLRSLLHQTIPTTRDYSFGR